MTDGLNHFFAVWIEAVCGIRTENKDDVYTREEEENGDF